jgi:hypothetical protein
VQVGGGGAQGQPSAHAAHIPPVSISFSPTRVPSLRVPTMRVHVTRFFHESLRIKHHAAGKRSWTLRSKSCNALSASAHSSARSSL